MQQQHPVPPILVAVVAVVVMPVVLVPAALAVQES